jgi:BirA family biotin operon repressor/biotin-[acetyl-CoA-carboxylase] ligase
VSKAAKRLFAEGYPVEVEHARGYRLRIGTPTPRMLTTLPTWSADRTYRYLGTVESTQDELRAWAEKGAPDGAVVLAERQLHGRGRHGRTWLSEPGRSLTFSVLLRPALPVAHLPLISLWAGVALARALGVRNGLKWPNDVLSDTGGKLAGILIESVTSGEETEFVIVGIGLNVDPPAPDGAATMNVPGGVRRSRADLLSEILVRFDDARASIGDSDTIVTAWKEHSGMLGTHVRVETPGGTIYGRAADIDSSGALLVSTPGGTERVHAGDVTIVRTEGDPG